MQLQNTRNGMVTSIMLASVAMTSRWLAKIQLRRNAIDHAVSDRNFMFAAEVFNVPQIVFQDARCIPVVEF